MSLAAVVGWLCVLAANFWFYTQFETNAVPVAFNPFKDFEVQLWDEGYIYLAGTLTSDSSDPKDELPLQTSQITCTRTDNKCRRSTASIVDHFVFLDVTNFEIKNWTGRFIYFEDDDSICLTAYYTIDRLNKSFQVLTRKKPGVTTKFCKGTLEEGHLTLRPGFDVYWSRIQRFRAKYGIYFVLLTLLTSAIYIRSIVIWFRRHAQLPRLSVESPIVPG